VSITQAARAAALTGLLGPAGPIPPLAVPPGKVIAVLREYGEPEPIEITNGEVAGMRAVAARLHKVFAAPDTATAARLLNEILAGAAGPPRLSSHDGTAWHLHLDGSDDDTPWDAWFAVSSAAALAELLAARQAPPGGLCAASGCGKPFVHQGGGTPRRYCSSRCATRERVAAHRRAHAGTPG
jgi:predicted RNA-binding Zn ribbon-like protein